MADEIKYTKRKTVRVSGALSRELGEIQVYEGDAKLLEWIAEFLGCSKAEAVRSAIRSMAAQLTMIDKRSPP
jgi:hypothetical protein